MKKYNLVTLYILFFSYCVAGQSSIAEFGKVSYDELRLKECSFEKDASAMYLFNTENVNFEINGYITKTTIQHKTRIKIFNNSGYKYANVVIKNAKTRYSKIDNIEAFIYNIDDAGKIISTPVSKDQIFKEKGSKKRSLNIRFTFPSVKQGSVIEYRYTMVKKNNLSITPWLFQDEIPTLISSCSVTTPKDIKLNSRIVTPQRADTTAAVDSVKESKNTTTKIFTLKEVPSFTLEPYMSSVIDNINRVEFMLRPAFSFSSNLQFTSSMLSYSPYFGRQITAPVKGTEKIIDSIKALNGNENKVRAVYNLITENVKWNDEQLYFAEDVEDAWQTKSGSSAEINLLLINLLKKAGIECSPVLVSTRENGKVDINFPSMGQFNGVDVLVTFDSSVYMLDGTQPYSSFKNPPLNILNRDALAIDNALDWINISDNRYLMNSSVYVKAVLDSSGIINGKAQITLKDYAKSEELKKRDQDEDERKKESKDFLRYDQENIVVDTSYSDTSLNAAEPLVMHMNFHYTLSNNDDYYFLNPFFFSMLRKNPFTQKERHSDIDFGCKQHYLTYLVIDIPNDFTIEELPKSIVLRTSDSSIIFRTDVSSGNEQVGIRYDFQLNNVIFSKEEYSAVKEFFEKIYTIINQQVLLKKKS